jgi:hypothetical protein
MDLEATAQALAAEPVSTEQVAETSTADAEPDYGAAYDKAAKEIFGEFASPNHTLGTQHKAKTK